MHIWIFQSGEPLHIDKDNLRPMRGMNLANTLIKRGHSVLLLSSSFYHQKKYHRSKTYKKIKINKFLDILLIPSPGYKKNLSILRLIDHFILAYNLKKTLTSQVKLPDVAFVGYPPIETAYVLVKWLKQKKIPVLLDIKDQWPQVFVDVLPKLLRPLGNLIFSPYIFLSKQTINQSTGISSISKSFLDWSIKFSSREKTKFDIISPLTSPDDKLIESNETRALNWWFQRGVIKNKVFKVIFVGSFSKAFDFDMILDAASICSKEKINCEFILCGGGEFTEYLRTKSKKYKNVKIFDWIDREKIVTLAEISSAFIAPYKNNPDFIMSIPNKVVDSLKFGLPLLSPLKGEVKNLIINNKLGFVYSDSFTLVDKIKLLIVDKTLYQDISNNTKKLYDEKFEFNKIYNNLINKLEKLKNEFN